MILNNKKNTPDLYAKLYSKYKIKGTPFLAYRDLPLILKRFAHGKTALDYGCGSGESSLFLKSLDYNVVSVDINKKMLEIAKEKEPAGQYIQIDGKVLPFKNKSFDLVFCSFVLLEIEYKEEILKIMHEITRVLKKNGIFISIAASDYTYWHNWLSLNTDFSENKKISSGSKVKIELKDINLTIDDYYWTEEDYKEIFHKAALTIVDVYNPLGTENDGYEWKDEKNISPYSIITCKK